MGMRANKIDIRMFLVRKTTKVFYFIIFIENNTNIKKKKTKNFCTSVKLNKLFKITVHSIVCSE
jgi:hypothetical protein